MIGAVAGVALKQFGGKHSAGTGLSLSVSADVREVERMVWKINQDVVPRARVSALNKTVLKLRTQAIRETASTTGVSPQMLIRQRYLTRRATLRRQEAMLAILLRPVPAVRLGSTKKNTVGAKQHAHGVTAGNRSYPSAWIGESRKKGGGPQVFHRVGKDRNPIDVHHVEIAQAATAINDRLILSQGRAVFAEICTRELKWRLENASR